MSSLPLSSTPTFFTSFSGKPPHLPLHKTHTPHHHKQVSCNSQKEEETPKQKIDRRNLLMGMGAGMYGSSALATPISGPDLSKCTTGVDFNTGNTPLDVNCCPPFSSEIDYILPPVRTMRYRPAAHLVSEEYVQKYKKAVELMKALPKDDPRSFYQQANVHCAYCNLSYEQTGNSQPQEKLQIHFCWHFYPWHRWYLYFYERILGKLIDDPTFGLPFWNWDNLPPASYIPAMYVNDHKSPLYNEHRNNCHLPPALADLKYSKNKSTSPDKIISSNLSEMYTEMIRTKTLEGFYGAKYVVGTPPSPGMGSVEAGSHTALHLWVGENTQEGLDLGNLYSAGREPLFFAHHANIDRLWSLWRRLPTLPLRQKEFTCKDWLDANYLFYDENKQLVRVYVRDTLDQKRMGYVYQNVNNPWLRNRPVPYQKKSRVSTTAKATTNTNNFPVKLDKVVKVLVERPKKKRSEEDKEKEEEVLVIEGIEADSSNAVRFEVYLNDVDDNPGELVDKAEYVGGFGLVPHKNSSKVKSMLRLGLSEALEDLEIEDDDTILVSLVPKAGGEDITIGGVKIVYVDYATENDN